MGCLTLFLFSDVNERPCSPTDWLSYFLSDKCLRENNRPLELEERRSYVETRDAHRAGRHGAGESFVCCGNAGVYGKVNMVK